MLFRKKPAAPAPAPNTWLGHPFPDYPGSKLRGEALLLAHEILERQAGPRFLELVGPTTYLAQRAGVPIVLTVPTGQRLMVELDVRSRMQPDVFDLERLADYLVRGPGGTATVPVPGPPGPMGPMGPMGATGMPGPAGRDCS